MQVAEREAERKAKREAKLEARREREAARREAAGYLAVGLVFVAVVLELLGLLVPGFRPPE